MRPYAPCDQMRSLKATALEALLRYLKPALDFLWGNILEILATTDFVVPPDIHLALVGFALGHGGMCPYSMHGSVKFFNNRLCST